MTLVVGMATPGLSQVRTFFVIHVRAISLSTVAGGQAYCWGENGSGQCGVPAQAYSEIQKPRAILISSATRPTQISCGYNFTSLLTNSGQLFTWGGGQSGQLGHGESRKIR